MSNIIESIHENTGHENTGHENTGQSVKRSPAQGDPAIAAPPSGGTPRIGFLLRLTAAALLVGFIGLGVVRYPLAPLTLAVPLVAYAALLWWRPVSFLLVIPCVLPAWDLGLWTGWMMVGESDLFIATTVA